MKMLRLKVAAAFASWIGDVALLKSRKNAHKASVLEVTKGRATHGPVPELLAEADGTESIRTWVDLLSREVSKLYATKHVAFIVARWRLRQISRALRTWRYTTGLETQSEHFELLWRGSLGEARTRPRGSCSGVSRGGSPRSKPWVLERGCLTWATPRAGRIVLRYVSASARRSRRARPDGGCCSGSARLVFSEECGKAPRRCSMTPRCGGATVSERKGHAVARLSRYLPSTMNGRECGAPGRN